MMNTFMNVIIWSRFFSDSLNISTLDFKNYSRIVDILKIIRRVVVFI